jgi:hypothetical protein
MKKILYFLAIAILILTFKAVPVHAVTVESTSTISPMAYSKVVVETETILQHFDDFDNSWEAVYNDVTSTTTLTFVHGYYLSGESDTYSDTWVNEFGIHRYKYATYSYTTY